MSPVTVLRPFSLDGKYGVAMSDEISVVGKWPKQSTDFVGNLKASRWS